MHSATTMVLSRHQALVAPAPLQRSRAGLNYKLAPRPCRRNVVATAAASNDNQTQKTKAEIDNIAKAATTEPVAFWGGFFAGIFALDLSQGALSGSI